MLPTLQFSWLIPFLRSCSWKLSLHQLEFEEFTASSLKKERLGLKLKWKKNYGWSGASAIIIWSWLNITQYSRFSLVLFRVLVSDEAKDCHPTMACSAHFRCRKKLGAFPASWDTQTALPGCGIQRGLISKMGNIQALLQKAKINLQRVMKEISGHQFHRVSERVFKNSTLVWWHWRWTKRT